MVRDCLLDVEKEFQQPEEGHAGALEDPETLKKSVLDKMSDR